MFSILKLLLKLWLLQFKRLFYMLTCCLTFTTLFRYLRNFAWFFKLYVLILVHLKTILIFAFCQFYIMLLIALFFKGNVYVYITLFPASSCNNLEFFLLIAFFTFSFVYELRRILDLANSTVLLVFSSYWVIRSFKAFFLLQDGGLFIFF